MSKKRRQQERLAAAEAMAELEGMHKLSEDFQRQRLAEAQRAVLLIKATMREAEAEVAEKKGPQRLCQRVEIIKLKQQEAAAMEIERLEGKCMNNLLVRHRAAKNTAEERWGFSPESL